MSTENQQGFQALLESEYQQYRHRSLQSELEEIAETMEHTILQRVFAEGLLQTDIAIDDGAKQEVRDAQHLLDEDRLDELANRLEALEEAVESEEQHVRNQIQGVRFEMLDTVNGMLRLNERVEQFNPSELQVLQRLLRDWNWKEHVYREDDTDIGERKTYARDIGEELRELFEDGRDAIFGPYEQTPLEELVSELLNGERLSLDELSDEQIQRLRDSDLEAYIELKLS